jgi:hypothetical protein
VRAADAAELDRKRRRALDLHLAGVPYQTIADVLGYATKAGAHKAVKAALEQTKAGDDLDGVATSELARLDAMLSGLWAKARKGDVAAIDRVLRIEERRAQILARADGKADAEQPKEATSLSDFERRLREREQRAASSPRGTQAG